MDPNDAQAPTAPRHHRQQILSVIGEHGQAAIAESHVLVVGCGALGCAAADQLARAGVGSLTLVDRDVVELTNLQRQTLYTESDIDRPKAHAAADRLRAVDSTLKIHPEVIDLTPATVLNLLKQQQPSVILDATDNFQTRYLLNDLCVSKHIPMVYGGVIDTRAMAMPVLPRVGPCLRCIHPRPPAPGTIETCDTAGVLGAAVQVAASLQVVEVLRIIMHAAPFICLTEQDVWSGTHRRLDLSHARDPECACCVHDAFHALEPNFTPQPVVICGQGAVQIAGAADDHAGTAPDFDLLGKRLAAHGTVKRADDVLRCVFRDERGDASGSVLSIVLFPDGRALVRGTSDVARARAVYARYVGV